MDEAKAPRIIGRPDGWVPERESDHFMLCPVCGGKLDCRDLSQVLKHWHDGPPQTESHDVGKPLRPNSESHQKLKPPAGKFTA